MASITKKAVKNITPVSKTFTDEERAAMQERARELKAGKVDGEKAVLAKIAEMPEPDRAMAKRLHALVKENAPTLLPKTWYGMPAYANKDGKVVCFFKSADKFKSRYATFGFEEAANLDEGNMWLTSFALKKLTPAEEAKIAMLVAKAVSWSYFSLIFFKFSARLLSKEVILVNMNAMFKECMQPHALVHMVSGAAIVCLLLYFVPSLTANLFVLGVILFVAAFILEFFVNPARK